MDNVSAYSDVAYLFLDGRKKEGIMLMSVIAPPRLLYYINKTLFCLLTLFVKVSLLRDARLPWAVLRNVRLYLFDNRIFIKPINFFNDETTLHA